MILFSCLHFYICVSYFTFTCLWFYQTNLLTTHNPENFDWPCFYYVLLIFPFILFTVPKLCFSKYKRDVERYGCCHSGKVPMDLMLRHQASLIKPVSFYIQLFEGQATSWFILYDSTVAGSVMTNTSWWGLYILGQSDIVTHQTNIWNKAYSP